MRHADGVAVSEFAAADVGSEAGEGETADYGFVGFAGAVAPAVVVIEASGRNQNLSVAWCRQRDGLGENHPAVNISIRCCSVVPVSSLLLRPENMPS